MNMTAPIMYPNTRRVGLADSSRSLLFHLLQREYQPENKIQTTAKIIEQERRYLRERVGLKPGTAIILERMLTGLYEDARHQLAILPKSTNDTPPQACPYTLQSLLETLD